MKRKIIKSSLILLFGGIITKILSMVIKISMNRIVGIKGISLYMLIMPTFSLFMSIGQLGLPISLSRLVALDNIDNKKLYYSIIPIVLLFNLVLMFFLILSSTFISTKLLHNIDLKYGIIAIGLVLPFTSISSICRSYFVGKEKMMPSVASNICENIVRLFFICLILPKFTDIEIKYQVFLIVAINIFSEAISTLILILFIPKRMNLEHEIFNKNYVKEAMNLSIYNLSSSLISNISYFLEPIILTNLFLYLGYSLNYTNYNYGIVTGYIIPMLCIPSFFTTAISGAILPVITKDYKEKRYKSIKDKLGKITSLLIIFGIIISIIFYTMGDKFLFILYKTTAGYNYLKLLSPFFIFYYVHAPFHIVLHAMGKNKDDLKITIINSVVRPISLLIFSLFKIGIYAFILSIIFNLMTSSFLLYKKVNDYLK